MYKIADDKLKLDVDATLDTNCPNDLVINFNVVDRVIIKINNKDIEIDKNKLAAFYMTLKKEDYYG